MNSLTSIIAALTLGNSGSPPESQPIPPSVTSLGQQNGVTAGIVTNLNVMPPLVRGPELDKFKSSFTYGAVLLRNLKDGNITDEQIDQKCLLTDQWANGTYQWLSKDMGLYAAERFLFRRGMSLSWNLSGPHKDGFVDKRSNCINALSDLLSNLDSMMRDPSVYPDK